MESQLIDLSNRQEYESVVEHGKLFDLNKFVTNDQFSTPPKQRRKHYLTSGAVYKGIQRSDRKDYEVKVELQVADFYTSICLWLFDYSQSDRRRSLSYHLF